MRKRNCVILLLCISIILSGCNSVESISNSSISSSATTVTTTSNEVTETPTDSSLATTESETETSIAYESYDIPEGLSREEIYWDVGQTLLITWSKYFYVDSDRSIYLREYSDFNETMMLEVLYLGAFIYSANLEWKSTDF
jgi:uncharacterized protein YceK